MVGDPIGDFLIQIKNAGAVGKQTVVLPYSKLKHAIADVLVKEGYISSVVKSGKKIRKILEIDLIYIDGKHKINGVERVSKPSRRLYTNSSHIPQVKSGYGTIVLSTPEGILTDTVAKEKNVGGEMLFKIW